MRKNLLALTARNLLFEKGREKIDIRMDERLLAWPGKPASNEFGQFVHTSLPLIPSETIFSFIENV
jgi:hypothetical protein